MAACRVKHLTSFFRLLPENTTFFRTAHSGASAALEGILREEIKNLKDANELKLENIITSSQKVSITVEGHSKKVLNFCANNYLGLSSHPDVVGAAKHALEEFGAGLSSVRFICGTQSLHKELESKLAKFHCREDAILYASCFKANSGFFEALLTSKDAVFVDEYNHPSIIDGICLCSAQKFIYKHNDMEDLEKQLKKVQSARLKMIVTCGVFPMDGDIAPLPDISKLSQKYCALMYVDDSHATGFIGKTGRGTEELCCMMGAIDIITSTLGKAFGGASGGYTTGSKELICFLRQKSRTYLYSNAVPPPVVGAGLKALDIVINDESLLKRLHKNTQKFRSAMNKAGFILCGEHHPICPIMLCNAKIAHQFVHELLCKGIYVTALTYPAVPKDKPRIRAQISAEHTDEHIDKAVATFIEVGKKLNVIK